ncbi:MAG: hypothetical protein AAGG48_08985 [Planctomycetota bacterium]
MSSSATVLLRQQLLIDRHVQGCLLWRTALYSTACGLYFFIILIFTEWMSHPDSTFVESLFSCLDESIYWAPGLMLVVPVVAYDLLKLTNRFAGPFFRLRREMKRLVDNDSERPLSFRDGDYWVEIVDDFNTVREELMELRKLHANQGSDLREAEIRQSKLFTDDADEESESPESYAVGS